MLGLTRLDEAVLYNPSTFELLYRGPAAGIESAIEQTLAGEKFDLISSATMGKAIDYRNASAHAGLSYANDIAPIIAENCAECHREGGIAPFAMDNSLAVQGWSPMIREVVMTKRMPPGQIDNKVGHKIKNEMNLSDDEMQMLVHWINNGSVVEGDSDPLTALTWPNTKWTLGEPDLIVKVPAQTIPPTGTVDYMDIPIDLGLTQDRWVRGSEVVPGAPSVLHHIITTVVPPEGAQPRQVGRISSRALDPFSSLKGICSGSGKSALLMLTRLKHGPDSGSIQWCKICFMVFTQNCLNAT